MNDPNQTRRIVHDIGSNAILKIVATVFIIWLAIQLWPVIVLVSLSLMLSATFNPIVRRLQARIPRRWAIATLLICVAALTVGFLVLLLPVLFEQGLKLVQHAPEYAHSLEAALARYQIRINLETQVEQLSSSWIARVPDLVGFTMNTVFTVGTVAILTVYLLIEGPVVGYAAARVLPVSRRPAARKMASEISFRVGGYMRGQLVNSLLAGTTSLVLLSLLEIPEPFALASLAAVADAIPVIGLLIALVPSVLMALSVSGAKAATVLLVMMVYHQIEVNLIAPRVFGRVLGLPLSIVVISFMVGYQLMGILGAVLALPLAAAVPGVIDHLQAWLGEDVPSVPPDVATTRYAEYISPEGAGIEV